MALEKRPNTILKLITAFKKKNVSFDQKKEITIVRKQVRKEHFTLQYLSLFINQSYTAKRHLHVVYYM